MTIRNVPMFEVLTRLKPVTVRCIEVRGECWIWTGRLHRDGYGRAGSGRPAHRVIYKRLVGPIPVGLEIDHLCRVIACVNPAHLEPVTPAENNRRKVAAQTHCGRGHEFTAENTYWRRGTRNCRTCMQARRAANSRKEGGRSA